MRLVFSAVIVFCFSVLMSCDGIKNETTLTQVQKDSIQQITCDSMLMQIQRNNSDTVGKVETVPQNFEECLVQLDGLFNDDMKAWIKCLPDMEFVGHVHNSLGSYLRSNWGLWRDNELAKSLYRMGIIHPDDMTAIILTCYQRRLKGEDVKLDEQIKYYQDYWRDYNVPVDSIIEAASH